MTAVHYADEDVDLGEGSLETLAKASRGDLRRAITSLQSAVRLKVCLNDLDIFGFCAD